MRLPTGDMFSGLLRLCVGIDARRPASWIALAAGCWAGWWSGAAVAEAGDAAALVFATMAAVGAVGDIPLDLCLPAGRSPDRRGASLWAWGWACERACWPLTGLLAAGLLAGGPAARGALATAFAGLLLAAATLAICRCAGATAADAASLTMVIASASAVAAVAGGMQAAIGGPAVAVGCWIVLGGTAWAWATSWRRRPTPTAMPSGPAEYPARGGADLLHLDPLPAGGALRRILVRLAMGTSLLAMAGWLVLANAETPDHAGGIRGGQDGHAEQVARATVAWSLLSAAWFVGLAVPQATLSDGVAGAGGWERLLRTTAGCGRADRRGTPRLWLRGLRLGRPRFAVGSAGMLAAILGWPAVVCAVMSMPTPAGAWPPLAIVIGLAAAAALLAAVVALGDAVAVSPETMFAGALAVVIMAAAVTIWLVSPARPVPLAFRGAAPVFASLGPPSVGDWACGGKPGGFRVAENRAWRETLTFGSRNRVWTNDRR